MFIKLLNQMTTQLIRAHCVACILSFSLFCAGSAFAQSKPTPANSKPPSRVSGLTISALIRGTMIAVNHANRTGNYTVLRDLGADYFSRTRSAAALTELFKGMREAGINLFDTVLLDPRIVGGAKLTTDGKLGLQGFFATKPNYITFDLVYFYEGGEWKIAAITIGARPAAPEQPKVTQNKLPTKQPQLPPTKLPAKQTQLPLTQLPAKQFKEESSAPVMRLRGRVPLPRKRPG